MLQAYGIVWKATDKKTKETVALKKIFDAFQNETDAQAWRCCSTVHAASRGRQCLTVCTCRGRFVKSCSSRSSRGTTTSSSACVDRLTQLMQHLAAALLTTLPTLRRLLNVLKADNDRDLYLTFDFMETDLHAVIRANILEEVHKQYIMYQLLKALKYLHSAELIHRDIKVCR